MKSILPRSVACLLVICFALPASAVTFADLEGWWAADPVQGGESSHVALQFVEQEGRQEARLWLMAIGAYDINLGTVKFSGDSIDTQRFSFPMTWNPQAKTLSGHLPADAAPVYDIRVEFRRSGPAEKVPPREWKSEAPQPTVVWSVDTGAAIWAGLERDGGSKQLFVGNEQGDVHCIGLDGKLHWKFATGKPVRAQPKVIGRHVYVASDSGYLYKLDIKSGAQIWRARIDAGSEPRLPGSDARTRWDRYGSSVAADANTLYVASRDKNLYAIDPTTGRERWRVAAGDIMTATPALQGGNVIFADYAGSVRAVAAKDGAPRWDYDAKLGVPGDLVVAEGRVLVGSRSYDLVALDAATGRELWKHYRWFSWIESPPAVRAGVIYTGSSDATNVYALNLADGSTRWKTAVPGYSWQRTAIDEQWLVAGTVGQGAYPGPRNGSLLALDRASGKLKWIYLVPPREEAAKSREYWGFGASPVIGDGRVYAADLDGKVYGFALR